MNTEHLISLEEFCTHYKVENSFIFSLQEFGLIEVITIQEIPFINELQLQELEKFSRFHYELNINLEGIDVITHLLQRVKDMQDKITMLENKLRQCQEY